MELTDDEPHAADPLMETRVDLAPEMRIIMRRCLGDVPMINVATGRAHLIVSFNVGDVTDLGAEQVALAEQLAAAACALRDEVRDLVAAR